MMREHDEHTTLFEISLPSLLKDYIFVDKTEIQPQEIIILHKAVGWVGDTVNHWQEIIDQPLGVIIGTRYKGKLIGMGRMTADPRHAVLCDLAVHPKHQHNGIGTALVAERMHIAQDRKIPYLYTELAPTNPLRSLYKDLGFVATGNGMFRNSK